MPASTGAHTRLHYDYESSFASGASSYSAIPFGSNATMDTLEGSHQAARVFEPDSREAAQIIEQLFDGSFTVSFELTNGWWIRAVISDIDDESPSGSGPYTYSFNNHAGGNTKADQYPNSMEIRRAVTKSGYSGDTNRNLTGAVVSNAEVSVSVGGNVTVTLTGAYADDEKDGTNDSQPAVDERTFTFAKGEVITDQDGTPTTVNRVQDVSFTIENNVEMVGEIGTRTPVDFNPGARNPSVDYTKIAEGDTELTRFYGGSSATSVNTQIENDYVIRLVFDNEKSGTDENRLEFDFEGSFPDSYGESGVGDPQTLLEHNMEELSTSVTANYTTDEASFP